MRLRTTLDAHALLTKTTLDGIHADVVCVPPVGDGVVFAAQALHQVHDDTPVVDDVPNSGKQPLQSNLAVHVLNAALAVRLWRFQVLQ
jgi:hypothetical protein